MKLSIAATLLSLAVPVVSETYFTENFNDEVGVFSDKLPIARFVKTQRSFSTKPTKFYVMRVQENPGLHELLRR